jgi:hypothetical protein
MPFPAFAAWVALASCSTDPPSGAPLLDASSEGPGGDASYEGSSGDAPSEGENARDSNRAETESDDARDGATDPDGADGTADNADGTVDNADGTVDNGDAADVRSGAPDAASDLVDIRTDPPTGGRPPCLPPYEWVSGIPGCDPGSLDYACIMVAHDCAPVLFCSCGNYTYESTLCDGWSSTAFAYRGACTDAGDAAVEGGVATTDRRDAKPD